jgi:molecular chaperone DnaK
MDKKEGDRKIAVYDLGGGTFDVSIIEIAAVEGEHQFEVLSTNGDTFLGGEDFDQRLMDYVADEFKKEQGVDLRKDILALQRLKEAAEKAKIELSSAQQTEINLPYITADASGPKHLTLKITRAKFESLVEELIKKTVAPCLTAIKDSGVKLSDISDVILVGGQTRMPKCRTRSRRSSARAAQRRQPGRGGGNRCRHPGRRAEGDVKDVLLFRFTPRVAGHRDAGRVMTKLIQKNTTIPTKRQQSFHRGRQPASGHHPCDAGRARDGARQQEPGAVQSGRDPACAARHAADRSDLRYRRQRHLARRRRTRPPARRIRSRSRPTRVCPKTRSSAWSRTPKRMPTTTARHGSL